MIPHYYGSILCLNCEAYIDSHSINHHSKICLRPSREVITHPQLNLLRIHKLYNALQKRSDRYSLRATEILLLLQSEEITEKQIQNCIEEAQILCQFQSNDILLDRVVQVAKISLKEISQLMSSNNSKTKDMSGSFSKLNLKRQISQKQLELESYRHQAQTYRIKTLESQQQLYTIANNFQD